MINCNPVRVDGDGLDAVGAAMRSGIVARGPSISALEKSFSQFTRVENAAAVANGTVAVLLAGMVTGLSAGDIVLVSGFSFASTANAFLALGCRVVPVDVSARSYNIDEGALERRSASTPRPERSSWSICSGTPREQTERSRQLDGTTWLSSRTPRRPSVLTTPPGSRSVAALT